MTVNIELEAFDPDQAEQNDLLAWYEFVIAVRKDEKPDRRTLPFDEWIADLRLPDAGYGPREFWGARLDGELVALNKGMIGVGNQASKGKVDNFTLQVLPPTCRSTISTSSTARASSRLPRRPGGPSPTAS